MSPEDILDALRRQPFEPFRVHLSDGTVYNIEHPDLVVLGLRSMIVLKPARGRDELLYERYHTVALSHVVRLEPLAVDSAADKDTP